METANLLKKLNVNSKIRSCHTGYWFTRQYRRAISGYHGSGSDDRVYIRLEVGSTHFRLSARPGRVGSHPDVHTERRAGQGSRAH